MASVRSSSRSAQAIRLSTSSGFGPLGLAWSPEPSCDSTPTAPGIRATALDVLGRVQDCGIAYCEEPVAGIEAIAAVGRRSPIPVAADESIRGEADAVRALDLGVTTLIVKPQALGGPDVALSIAARANEAGASVVVTSFLDSAVGVAHALHVAAAVDAAAPQSRAHGLATATLLASDVAEAPPVVAGAMAVPGAKGLGLVPKTGTSPISGP